MPKCNEQLSPNKCVCDPEVEQEKVIFNLAAVRSAVPLHEATNAGSHCSMALSVTLCFSSAQGPSINRGSLSSAQTQVHLH
jgi:hypothetical protein